MSRSGLTATESAHKPMWKVFAAQFASPLIYILFVAADTDEQDRPKANLPSVFLLGNNSLLRSLSGG